MALSAAKEATEGAKEDALTAAAAVLVKAAAVSTDEFSRAQEVEMALYIIHAVVVGGLSFSDASDAFVDTENWDDRIAAAKRLAQAEVAAAA